jgi:hypothetical protein
VNGQALSAAQQKASGTVTAAGVNVADTVTVAGVVFTAGASENLATGQFNQSSTDTATATSLAACINASTNAAILGLIEAKNASAVCTIYAAKEGTAGNSYSLATSNNTRLAKSGTALANGAALANNAFDYIGTNAETAAALAAAVNASTTGLVGDHVKASNLAGTVTLAGAVVGDWVRIGNVTLTAVTATATNVNNQFSIAGSDTQDGDALVTCINSHPTLKEMVLASNISGAVTIRQLPQAGTSGHTLYTSSGTRLGITGTVNTKLASSATVLLQSTHKGTPGNAVTLAASNGITASAARMTGGTDTLLTF